MLCIPDRAYVICQRPTSQLARGAFMGMTTANQFISRNLHTQKANLKIEGNVTWQVRETKSKGLTEEGNQEETPGLRKI